MCRNPKQTLLHEGIQMGNKHENMFNITNYQRNANQNYGEISPHTGQNGHHQKSTNNKCWKGVEKRERSCIDGGDVN